MYRDCKMNIKNSMKKVVFEITSSCNLRCNHCFYQQSNEFITNCFLRKKKAFALIDKFKKSGIKKLVLTGGEPTVHPDFIEIAKYAKKNIPKATLCTNGVIENIKLKRAVIDLNFDTYTISIDSCKENNHDEFRGRKGAFKKVISFAKLLNKNNKNLSIHIALHQNNIDHIEETIDFCRQFNCEIVVGSIYYEKLGFNDKIIDDYQKKIQGFKNEYLSDKDIILVGFCKYCESEQCLDQKQVFTVDSHGQLVSCYWKKGGGKIIKKF
jgi:MoaA/NifB/PqqE/SkfB family radical SAM enzyme